MPVGGLSPDPADMQHWSIDDPAAVEGSDEGRLAAFRAARDAIEARIVDWLRSSWLGRAGTTQRGG